MPHRRCYIYNKVNENRVNDVSSQRGGTDVMGIRAIYTQSLANPVRVGHNMATAALLGKHKTKKIYAMLWPNDQTMMDCEGASIETGRWEVKYSTTI